MRIHHLLLVVLGVTVFVGSVAHQIAEAAVRSTEVADIPVRTEFTSDKNGSYRVEFPTIAEDGKIWVRLVEGGALRDRTGVGLRTP
jgi:hypothetical protein